MRAPRSLCLSLLTSMALPSLGTAQSDALTQGARSLYDGDADFERTWPVEFHIRVVEPITHRLAESAKTGGRGFDPNFLAPELRLTWGEPGTAATVGLGVRRAPWGAGKARVVTPAAFMKVWSQYLTAFAAPDYTELKIRRGTVVRPGVFTAETTLHVAGAATAGGVREDHGPVRITFTRGERGWQITEITAVAVVTDTRDQKLFENASAAMLASLAPATLQRLQRDSISDALHHELLDSPLPPQTRLGPLGMDAHPGGVVVDIDADGWDDLYVWDVSGPATLLRNVRGERFEDATRKFGLELSDVSAVSFADLDNDGTVDVVVGRWLTPSQILFGARTPDGGLRFSVSAQAPALPQDVATVSVVDVDRDGLLDVFFGRAANDFHAKAVERDPRLMNFTDANVNQLGPPSFFLTNAGHRTFRDTTRETGLLLDRNVLQAGFADFNGDGFPDVFIGNDFAPANFLVNRNGRFEDITKRTGADAIIFGMGVSWGDFDNDGDL
ncbi:MAG TPA: VCBS repeat-containing protein, partial [Myxococcota bacterium]|nr:VCBS repeat-containing protein [Myxococcota bacterium]